MTLSRVLLALVLVVGSGLGGAEPSSLGDGATNARTAAEQELAATRQRLATEQAELLATLQRAVAANNAARDRSATAERVAATTAAELASRTKEQDRELAVLKQTVDRAVIAARLDASAMRAVAGAPPRARIAAAVASIDARIQALPARLSQRVGDESVIGRDGHIVTVPVLRLGEARAVALGNTAAQRGLMERAVDGHSWLVTGPLLPSSVRVEAGRVSLIPLDAAGTAAHQPGAVHRTLGQWLAAGRAFIWPILAVALVGLVICLERMRALSLRTVDPLHLVTVANRMAEQGAAAALVLVEAGLTPLDRVLRAGLQAPERSREAREAVVEQALLAEIGQLNRGLPALAMLAGVAPLLGLLGTVTGMIDMFSVIAAQGSGNAKSLSGGISEALICTQAGMLVAIPLLVAHAWLSRLADRRAQLLEEAACGVLGLSESP